MHLLIRADGGLIPTHPSHIDIASGHLMRMLSIATGVATVRWLRVSCTT